MTLSKKGITMNNLKKFFINGAVAVSVTLLIRIVSMAMNVYISSKLGTAAMGLLTLVMSVYGFAVTFASSGINLAVTRMVAEALGRGDERKAIRSMRICLAYAAFFGLLASILLFCFSEHIGVFWLGDARTVSSLKFLSLSLTPIALSSALSGYFTAVRRVPKNAVCSVFEQAVKIFLTVYGLVAIAPKGIEFACLAVVGGASLAEFSSFFLSFILFLHDKKKHLKSRASEKKERSLFRYMLSITLPVAFSSYARSALVTLEHMLIPRGLRKNGANTETALSAYGMLHGMALPLVLFPGAIPAAFASLIIPEVAERHANGNQDGIQKVIGRVFKVTLGFSIAVAAIIFTFSDLLGTVVYKSSQTGIYIKILAPLIPVMYLDNAVDAVLKGLGEQFASMKINIADAALSVILVYFLTPTIGLYGYVITIFICELLNVTLSILKLSRVTDFKIDIKRWVLLPVLVSVACCFFARTVTKMLFPSISILSCIISIALCAASILLFFIPQKKRSGNSPSR